MLIIIIIIINYDNYDNNNNNDKDINLRELGAPNPGLSFP